MKIIFLSRYQNIVERGAENFVKELSFRISKNHTVDIFSDKNADSLGKILEGHYDIVIPVNGRLQSLKVSLGRMIKNYKILISGHSGRGWDDIWNIAVTKPDVFVALTNYMAKWAKRWAWGSKVIKIANGVDLDKFSPIGKKMSINMPRPIILSAGALVWYKYHERVIDAVAKNDTGSVLIAGDGPLKEKLENKGKEKLGKRFMIMRITNEDMPKVYRSVDLFTLPSWDREAFGIVYLEAMASGLPIVAPDDQSRREIIGDAGIFADVSNIEEYAAAIKFCLKKNWEKRSRHQAENFSWDKIAIEYEKVMKDLVK